MTAMAEAPTENSVGAFVLPNVWWGVGHHPSLSGIADTGNTPFGFGEEDASPWGDRTYKSHQDDLTGEVPRRRIHF